MKKKVFLLIIVLLAVLGLVLYFLLPKDGEDISYYDGQLGKEVDHNNGEIIDGEYTEFWENGNIKNKKNYKDGRMDGNYIQYDKDGHILFSGVFKDGQEWDGKFGDLDFCISGDVQAAYIVNIENGERNGKYISYHPCNDVDNLQQIKSKGTFKDGKCEGEWLEYRGNGELREEYTCKNGIINGEYLYYDYGGDISRKSMYVDGKLNGKEYEYHNGEIIKVYERENGELIDSYPYSDNSLYKEIFK